MFFVGWVGIFSIVANFWKIVFYTPLEPWTFIWFLTLAIFSTAFFGWMVSMNVRSDEEIRYGDKKNKKKHKHQG